MQLLKGFRKCQAWVTAHDPGQTTLFSQRLQICLVGNQNRSDRTGLQLLIRAFPCSRKLS